MATDAQKKATATYRKKSVRQIVCRFFPKDEALYSWVKAHGGSAYLKLLAEREMLGQ